MRNMMIGRKPSVSTIVIVAVLIMAALICIYPLWYTLIMSFSNKSRVAAGVVVLWPMGVNTLAYERVLSDRAFFRAFGVSVFRVVLGCSINMLLTMLAAYPLSRSPRKFRFRKYYVWFLMFNMLFSGGLIPWYINIRNFGLIDTIWALVLPTALPIYYSILLMNFFKGVPEELNESATIDGANAWIILFRIYLPISKPALATILLFAFVGHWNAYFDGLVLINSPGKQPLQTYIYQLVLRINTQQMNSEEIKHWAQISNETLNAAKVILALVPIMAIYPFLQKYFVVGLTLGSLKG